MLRKLVHRILKPRHYWRTISFNELSEIYISMMLRSLALSITGIFVPVFLFRLHYSVMTICMLYGWYFTFRILGDIMAGHTVARIGPKHAMAISYILQVASAATFLSLQTIHWPIWLLGGLFGMSNSFFFIAFHVDFSKIKHSDHGGKEIGYVNIMEKVGAALGPLVGGIVASLFGARYTFAVAIGLVLLAIVPLMQTPEPTRIRQHLDFRGLSVRKIKWDILSYAFLGIENTLCLVLWPLYLSIFVLFDSSVYVRLGLLTTASVVTCIVAAQAIGRLIDKRRGRRLLRYGAISNGLLYLIRPFVSTYFMAFGIGAANEVITAAYRMPYTKGFYDAADDKPGHRIAYIVSVEAFSSIVKAMVWWFIAILASGFDSRITITAGFAIAAIASCLVTTEHFKALKA